MLIQEVEHVAIRQVRQGNNRESVSVSGALPETWFGMSAPGTLEENLESIMKSSMNSYMSATFGVRKQETFF